MVWCLVGVIIIKSFTHISLKAVGETDNNFYSTTLGLAQEHKNICITEDMKSEREECQHRSWQQCQAMSLMYL